MRKPSTIALLALFFAPGLAVSAGGCDTGTNIAAEDKDKDKDKAAKVGDGSDAKATQDAKDRKANGGAEADKNAAPAGGADPAKPDDPAGAKDVGLGVDAASDRDIQAGTEKMTATLNNYSTCTMKCGVDPDTPPTDVESCLLTCRNTAESAGVAPKTPQHGLIIELDSCMERCNDKKNIKPTNRSTCRLNCENAFKAQQAELRRKADER